VQTAVAVDVIGRRHETLARAHIHVNGHARARERALASSFLLAVAEGYPSTRITAADGLMERVVAARLGTETYGSGARFRAYDSAELDGNVTRTTDCRTTRCPDSFARFSGRRSPVNGQSRNGRLRIDGGGVLTRSNVTS